MKKMIVSAMMLAVFTCGTVMAQDTNKKDVKTKTECCQKDKKTCTKDKKECTADKKDCPKDKKATSKQTDKKSSCSGKTTCPVKK